MTARDTLNQITERAEAWVTVDMHSDVLTLVAAVGAVLDLHALVERPDPRDEPGEPEYYGTDRFCAHCGHWGDDYPCQTVVTINEALGGAQ